MPEALAGVMPALLEAGSLAARSALVGGAVFLLAVASPLARRLPGAQGAILMGRMQAFLRLAALATMGLAGLQFLSGQFFGLGVMLAALAVLLLAPREGPAPRLAAVIVLFAAIAMLIAVSGGRAGLLTWRGLTTATLLREAGAALWMGNLPLLWALLQPGWPAAVPQAIGVRHAWLMLGGMALSGVGMLIGWPHRTLLFGPEAFPLAVITMALLLLALVAAGLRVALLIEAGRASAAGHWLPRLRCLLEIELLVAIALCGPIIALFVLAAEGMAPEAQPAFGALLPRFSLHALGPTEASGLVLMLIALLAWLSRAGGEKVTRFGPVLLVPLGAALVLEAADGMALALGALVLLAGLAEASVAWRGRAGGLAFALPFAVILGVVLVLAGRPSPDVTLPALLATLALLIRWAELRLPDARDALAASLAWPMVLGALGLVLMLARGG